MKRLMLFSIKTKLILAGGFLLLIFSLLSFHSISEHKRNTAMFMELDQLRAKDVKLDDITDIINSLTLTQAQAILHPTENNIHAIQSTLGEVANMVEALDFIEPARKARIKEDLFLAAEALKKRGNDTAAFSESIVLSKNAAEEIGDIGSPLDEEIRKKRHVFRDDLLRNPYDSLWILISAYALLLALALVVKQEIFSPLHQITQRLRSAAADTSGCLDYIIPKTRSDEVGSTQQALNQLLRNTADTMNALSKSNYISSQRLAAIELIREGVGITDTDGFLVYANRPYFIKHGISLSNAANYIGRPWHDLLSKQDAERIDLYSWRTLENTGNWEGEVRINIAQDKEKLLEISLTKLQDGNILRTVRDITLKREAEIERAKLQELFGQSQKMEAIGRLTGGIAHDFNNILTIIGGNLDLMKDRFPANGELRHIQIAERAILRGSELTQQLLSFSKKQVLSPKILNINSLLPDMWTLLSRATGEDVDIQFDMAEHLWNVRIDAGQLETALLNLIINSRDAMTDGGVITISTENIWMKEAGLFLNFTAKPGPYVKLTISDSGAGISKENMPKVFEPFFTTKEKGKGTGLGLSMVYGFGKQSGGYIDIQSEENVGTSVSLFFPRHEAEAQEPLSVETLHSSINFVPNYETVLVVEDEEDVLELNRSILERAGFKVICAANGAQAMEIIKAHPTSIEILITDMVMPGGIGGKQLAEFTRSLRPDIKIIMVSGYAYDHIEELENDPNARFIYKPYSQKKLISELSLLLNNNQQPVNSL